MKFDKETIAAFTVCIILLIAWDPFCRYMGWIKPLPVATATTTTAKPETIQPASAPAIATPVAVPVATVKNTGSAELKQLPSVEISNTEMTMKIDPNQGIVTDIVMKKYQNDNRKDLLTFKSHLQPGTLSVVPAGTWTLFKVVPQAVNGSEFKLHRFFSGSNTMLEITQTWKLTQKYQYQYGVSLRNASATPLTLPELEIVSASIEPLAYQGGDNIRTESHGIDYYSDSFNGIDADAKDAKFNISVNTPIHWFGVRNKYFAMLIKPEKEFAGLKTYRTQQTAKDTKYYIIASAGIYKNITIPSGYTQSFDFTCYTGPKELDLLTSYDPQTQQILHLSFMSPMEWISKMLLKFLIYLKDICCGSYGWAIIVLTIIVRLLLWPITQKANNSMKRMQKLQPLVQEIRTKNKDNPQVMNTKIMELYREKKVNPLGGCLPILLQIPVFIALYSTIDSAAELRHTSFMWAQDLAQPDTVATIMGLGINPLVLVMTVLMVLQQKMTPMATMDPMQQKMMLFMPIVMLLFLYSLPSGLTLYWTVSQIFSIFQLLITQKFSADDTTVNLPKKA